MFSVLRFCLLTLLFSAAIYSMAANAQTNTVLIPYEKFQLDNGLTVVVHEDRKAPIVAVSVWYHVGSKDEKPGKTGFAHLFEHLMFNGSENYNDEYFKPFEQVGATGMNGTTWLDRTNYFENVPTPALEMALWMESDRMGHLLGVIDQAKLDEQRGVVQNEKRQGENQPYGTVNEYIQKGLFPVGHPYRWRTIGSMDDLNAASLDDVKDWFKTYYGAANTVVVLAGDIDAATARPLVNKYFGDIDSGPPVAKLQAWVPERGTNTRQVLQDQVPQARIFRNWAVPGRTDTVAADLYLASYILGGSKSSRLYKVLVHDQQLATSATSSFQPFEIASLMDVDVTLKSEDDRGKVEAIIDAELARFRNGGPTKAELERAKTTINASTIRGLEQVGGFGGKAVTLAQGEVYAKDPGYFEKQIEQINSATAADVQKAAQRWMNNGWYQITVTPFADYSTVASSVDRSKGLPAVGELPNLEFPTLTRGKLDNGIEVVVAQRSAIPVVQMAVVFDAGFAADAGGILGMANFTGAMLSEGTKSRTGLEINAESEMLGAQISTDTSLDSSQVTLSALKENLKGSVALYADVMRNPAFNDKDIRRLRGQWLAQIQQEKAQPVGLALRTLPPLLYGKDHAYGIPLTGSGTVAAIESITAKDLNAFHKNWMRPDNAKVFVAGDTDLDSILPILNRQLGNWQAPSSALPKKEIFEVELPAQQSVYLIDKPGAPQSMIIGGHVAPGTGAKNNIAIDVMNDIIGGTFTSRINMNLREDKHWAYGAYTFFVDAEGQRPMLVYAPVQTDKTSESFAELEKELNAYLADQPATQTELDKVVNNRTNSLPGQYETAVAVLEAMISNAKYDRPDDYVTQLPQQYRNLNLTAVNAAAAEVLHPKQMVWVIVGDRGQIEGPLKESGVTDIQYLNADGEVVD